MSLYTYDSACVPTEVIKNLAALTSKGPQGPRGATGVVTVSDPLTYDSLTQSLSLDEVPADILTGTLPDDVAVSATVRPSSTAFNTDGSIVETYNSGLVVTTTFNTDGSITEVYGAPVSQTKTTVFNSNGTITETVS